MATKKRHPKIPDTLAGGKRSEDNLEKAGVFEIPFGSTFSRLYQGCNEHIVVTSRVIDDDAKKYFHGILTVF